MVTTIQIGEDLLNKLKSLKLHEKESYDSLIWDLIEDRMELSDETKKKVDLAEEDIRKGRVHKWEDIKEEFKINV
tara:strand:+ start:972 stop:1196 length:225 start_codon:yes stop_codon:yes gene_type:complete